MNKIDLVKLWFIKAEEDRKNIDNNLNSNNIPYGTVCFHAQQMAEKYLKGFLIFHEKEFPKTHIIEDLIAICKEIDEDFEALELIIGDLSDYAVLVRYPDDWHDPTHQETIEAYIAAKKIRELILRKIPEKLK